jgi:hypothetical protein
MKFKSSILITINVVLLVGLMLPTLTAAQHTQYKTIDIGTLGGVWTGQWDRKPTPERCGNSCEYGEHAYA